MSAAKRTNATTARSIVLRALLGTGVLIAGAGVALALYATRPQPAVAPAAQRSLAVSVVTATPRPVARVWTGFGTARAVSSAVVAAETPGVVVERPASIDVGRWVDAGDLLVRLDDAEYRERLVAAREAVVSLESQVESLDVEHETLVESAELADDAVELARRELTRARDAFDRGAATQNEIDRLERELTRLRREAAELRQRRDQTPIRRQQLLADIRRQRAEARLAQLNVDRARIGAPISGVAQRVHVDVGDWVGVGAPVARIVDLRRIEAPMRMPLSAGADVRVGDEIDLIADGASELRWAGTITRAAPEADPESRTLTLFVEIEQEGRDLTDTTLRPGQFLLGRARASAHRERIVVPRIAVNSDRVAIIGEDGRVRTVPVEIAFHIEASFPDLDPRETQWAVVSSGLQPGDRVIVSNLDELQDGVPVKARDVIGAEAPTARRTERQSTGGSVTR